MRRLTLAPVAGLYLAGCAATVTVIRVAVVARFGAAQLAITAPALAHGRLTVTGVTRLDLAGGAAAVAVFRVAVIALLQHRDQLVPALAEALGGLTAAVEVG